MSVQTKSFFEQDHRQKRRPATWHRAQHRPALAETSRNTTLAKPPIPATTQAKSKLKEFQFVSEQGEEVEQPVDEKENGKATHDDGMCEEDNKVVNGNPKETEEAPSSANRIDELPIVARDLSQAHGPPPCTPATRLPLEDLIGNFDETPKPAKPTQCSPEEHVGWIPNSSSTLLTPSRKRKRARSSSPSCPATSSQRRETSTFLSAAGAPAEKKTPEDPAAALWRQLGREKQGAGEDKPPEFGYLIFQPSPRALETPAKNAGMQRSASAGNVWPTSSYKRRRVTGHPSISVWQQHLGDSGHKSKVAAMVEKLQESLATQQLANSKVEPDARVEAPSSSSPLPEAGATKTCEGAPDASPLQAKHQPAERSQSNARAPNDRCETGETYAGLAKADDSESLHHSGAIGRDPRQPQLVQGSAISAALHLQSKVPLPAYKRPSMIRAPSNITQHQSAENRQESFPQVTTEDLDEFGEDLDFSAEDLEELMSQPIPLHRRPLYQIPPLPNPPPQRQITFPERDLPAVQQVADGTVQPILMDDEDDEFGCDDFDEASLAQAEITATQMLRVSPARRSPRKLRSPRKPHSPKKMTQVSSDPDIKTASKSMRRLEVKRIVESEYTNDSGRRCLEKLLVTEDLRTNRPTAITLRDSWTATWVSAGNIVHIADLRQSPMSSCSSPPGQITVSDAEASPLLIVHPDHMLSATTVADSFDCLRKAVLQDRIKATNQTNKSMVYGKILHEIFQQALAANRWDEAFLNELIEATMLNHLDGLWELGMRDTVLAEEEVQAKMGELAAWARIYVAESPSKEALVDAGKGDKIWTSISKLIAIEEHIWSPLYGLKGNVDATVQITVVDHPQEAGKKLIVPLEVKTGRTTQSAAHRAQTALYTLLLSDRYDVNVKSGILYYLESSTMSRIATPVLEIRQMVQQRNRLATYINRARNPSKSDNARTQAPQTQEIEESGLPGMLKNPFKCSHCYARVSCFTYHGLVERGSADSAGMVDDGKKQHSQVWHEAVGQLHLAAKNQSQAEALRTWFSKWDRLLTFEERELSRFRRELWTMDSAEREAAGRCFGNLVVAQNVTATAAPLTFSGVHVLEGSGGKINRFVYRFVRSVSKAGGSFIDGTQLTVGEPIVISSESEQWALANGYIIGSTKHDITVAVDRKIGDARQRLQDFDEERNQVFRGIMNVGQADIGSHSTSPKVLYRLDKDEFSNGLALVRNNLVTLMSSHPIHTKLRKLLIFGERPSFDSVASLPPLPPSQLGDMNEDQRAAVGKVLSAQDYALILGMPGTGKTTTIAHVIRALLAEEKSILLTSFTHTAVDNILLKIRDIAPRGSVLRLGVPAKINPQVQQFCQLAAAPRTSIDEIEQAYMGCRIVATTCMGTNHPIFNRRAFDVCIVDEGSQITLPTSLGPLLHARKFILVGDHYQLPPLVQNKAALEGGLDVSLFRQLSEQHPEAMATLGKQYRMCEDIMTLSNTLIYNGQLRCGSDTVAQQILHLPHPSALDLVHTPSCLSSSGRCWLAHLTCPTHRVVFANTDPCGAAATEILTSGKNITNPLEAALAAQLVHSFLALGVPAREIGVMTLYRSQLTLLRSTFRAAGVSAEVEIDSADRFQGRDKDAIVLSFVRSNPAGVVGELLRDWRRVNVALTRARAKLVMIGSRRTLGRNELLGRLGALVDERGWGVALPEGAEKMHALLPSSAGVQSPPSSHVTPRLAKGHDQASTPTPSAAVLRESRGAGNRSPLKVPGKVISGRERAAAMKRRAGSGKAMQDAAFEIFQDITESSMEA